MRKRNLYAWGVAILCFVVLMIATPAIPQSQEYHNFADQRQFFGIPNTLNVVSNFPFIVIGVIGLVLCYYNNYFELSLQGELWGWTCFFIGVAAVGVGSSYYHLDPDDARLVWDRLPMTIAFTSIMAVFIIERIDEQKGTVSIIPLLLAGVISILGDDMLEFESMMSYENVLLGFKCELDLDNFGVYWSIEAELFDDLRPYAVIQFVPCIVIPIMAILLPPMYTHSTYWLWAAVFYLLAKIEEAMDKVIYEWTHHIVSGHTLKHLCAAMVPVFLTLMLVKRTTETNRGLSVPQMKRWNQNVPKRLRIKDKPTEDMEGFMDKGEGKWFHGGKS
ncbi:putative S-adenosylmethionine-dependent methyltransferase [Hibiscus syriacus]|uniref:S-adenosylmethionine-dependent methyltransferase n=1 Tax=Hibiscus syriacus TaxID=106335 RepID=A0A6A3C3E7_HIBSY|nr:putative S-adenosylmethionine-dependent methyltransferase [Hibiscus syriacus]